MAIKVTTAALICVLDSQGKITGYEAENHYTYEAEGENDPMAGAFKPFVRRDAIPEVKFTDLTGASSDLLTDALTNAGLQIADLQAQIVEAQAQTKAAKDETDFAIKQRDAALKVIENVRTLVA